eukprot:6126696-Pyramimonas_sp.AAC.3
MSALTRLVLQQRAPVGTQPTGLTNNIRSFSGRAPRPRASPKRGPHRYNRPTLTRVSSPDWPRHARCPR